MIFVPYRIASQRFHLTSGVGGFDPKHHSLSDPRNLRWPVKISENKVRFYDKTSKLNPVMLKLALEILKLVETLFKGV